MFDVKNNSKLVSFNGKNVRVMSADQVALYLVANNNEYTKKMTETVKIAVAGPLEDEELKAYEPIISDNNYSDVIKLERESQNGLNRYGFLHYGFEAKLINEEEARELKPGCYYLVDSLVYYHLLDTVNAKDLKPAVKQVKKPVYKNGIILTQNIPNQAGINNEHIDDANYYNADVKLIKLLKADVNKLIKAGKNTTSTRSKYATKLNSAEQDAVSASNVAVLSDNHKAKLFEYGHIATKRDVLDKAKRVAPVTKSEALNYDQGVNF